MTLTIDRSEDSPFGADGCVLVASSEGRVFHVAMSDEGDLGATDPPAETPVEAAPPAPAPAAVAPPPAKAPIVESEDSPKSKMVATLLCVTVGFLGIHRFYLGKIGTGVLQLLTFGGCGLWVAVDMLLLALGKMTDGEGRPVK